MIDPQKLLARVPAGLRDELLERYREIARNYIERRWEPSELNGGKFAEAVYAVIDGALSGTYPQKATKPPDFSGACRALESRPASPLLPGNRSLRVLIPRTLVALYDVRNNRGVGHIGGDVDPNAMDATAVFSSASWVLAELVRIFHGATTTEAQQAVDALAERTIPVVWLVPGTETRRVLQTGLSAIDQTLLLLHVQQGWLSELELFKSIEYSQLPAYRSKVLWPLHKKRLVEYDREKARVHLTPLGAKQAESLIETT